MLKASALYMVIIIALVIGILCSSLVLSAYYYRLQYQKSFRYDRLQTNLGSGENILLAGADSSYNVQRTFSLFGDDADSVSLQRVFWGVYDIGVVRAFDQKDTLYKVFSIAHSIDSGKWAALYLTDNDRPMAVSGKTMIRGDAFIPKSGVNQAYLNNQAYSGDKRLIIGRIHNSERELPALDTARIGLFRNLISREHGDGSLHGDSITNSFLISPLTINLGKEPTLLAHISIAGNIIIFSDTSITIDSTAVLNHMMIFARSITVKSGFHGNCQLFARDTIGIGQNCRFDYPSCLGILRFKSTAIMKSQERISLGTACSFSGIIFTYEFDKNPVLPLIDLGNKVQVTGQVYSQGMVAFKDNAVVAGSLFTTGFLYRTSFTLFQNDLMNTTLDESALSPYYLTSGMLPVAGPKKKVLQWLEAN